VDQPDFCWVERLTEGCDYYAVYRVGKKHDEFVANVLARNSSDAAKIVRKQIYLRPLKGRTQLQAIRIGLSGYAAKLKSVSMCLLMCCSALGQSYTGGDGSFGQYNPRSGFYSGRTSDGSYYSGSYDPRSGFYSGYVNGRYYWGYGFQFAP